MITYLWVKHKRENKKAKELLIREMWVDGITTRYRGSIYGDYPDRDYFIPLREFMKEDFLPKKRMKVHKLVERKQTLGGTHLGPGVYTREVDHSIIVRRNRDE